MCNKKKKTPRNSMTTFVKTNTNSVARRPTVTDLTALEVTPNFCSLVLMVKFYLFLIISYWLCAAEYVRHL